MAFDHAHRGNKLRGTYRQKLAEARNEALDLAKMLIKKETERIANGELKAPSKAVMTAVQEILRDGREVLNKRAQNRRKGLGDGIPGDDARQLIDALEGEDG